MQNVRQVALELLDCERVTLFLIFERRGELRAMIDQNQILRIQFGEGIAGLVAQTGGSMNLPDVYEHPMFNKEVDRVTGFRTRSMLCMAVSDMTGKNVAVLQALNKRSGQPFTPADERSLRLFGTHLGNTLVKAKLHETAKREKERLQAIYTCFKSLNAAEEVGQMVVCATAALERHIIHAERVLFFLVDKPRGELWLHTHQAEAVRLRVGQQGGVVGMCAESRKPQSWAEFADPHLDPALGRLPAHLAPLRIKSVLVQPVHVANNDRVLAVVLALNKREAEGTSDIFFEPFFTDADCDAMALFAYEMEDLLSERTLELSLLSALSVVGHDGAHPSVAVQGAVGGGGAEGGGGTSTPGGPSSAVSLSGDEDFIRSRLIQMYLPECKMESPGSHGGIMFNRNSFSAATATANQMRASMDRKRTAGLSLSLIGDGGPAGAKRPGSGPGLGGSSFSRRSDLALPSHRMSLALRYLVSPPKQNGWGCGGVDVFRRISTHERLMAPWRRLMPVKSAGGAVGAAAAAAATATVVGEGNGGGKDGGDGCNADEAYEGGGGGGGTAAESISGLRMGHMPQPFGDFARVHEELRTAAEESLRVNVFDPQSVLENHHCAMTFAILSRADCNLLAVLTPEEQRAARKVIIAAILCTDMANHFTITQEFQKHGLGYEPDNESDRLLLIKIILHAADIGNAVRPFHVNHVMSRRVHREFEAQAHEEMSLGLPVTFSVDTSDRVMCARVELNFLLAEEEEQQRQQQQLQLLQLKSVEGEAPSKALPAASAVADTSPGVPTDVEPFSQATAVAAAETGNGGTCDGDGGGGGGSVEGQGSGDSGGSFGSLLPLEVQISDAAAATAAAAAHEAAVAAAAAAAAAASSLREQQGHGGGGGGTGGADMAISPKEKSQAEALLIRDEVDRLDQDHVRNPDPAVRDDDGDCPMSERVP
ncbi:hypothetical protein VOLCADRAFT_99277 [Volvox carteri f. nagariensis]|uniref:PDEase domain-containing protein n=1 Tax=Volvox carteri f. nagariensis TaxID=3068 RepID=D8UHE2_VOLCA|nr:uncharacterized protein VOLCADRAFT_99277 [Volvox carteri f. nagariensis]EFJ40838.1 hypothetical protein VOLCADRAFT_99277 [Volvox carteri f. nagariensis]|eukprot:XP_002958107.1 hypothetical protein VOLCADRAFT_99277 [Volvox carteri f. nagariensis]